MTKKQSIYVTQTSKPKLGNATKRERKVFYIQLLTQLLEMRKQQLSSKEE